MQAQPGFRRWRGIIQERHDLRHRLTKVDIAGISQMLEYRSPTIEVSVDLYDNRLDAADMIVQVSARSGEPEPVKAAQRVENWNYSLYHDLKRRRTSRVYGADRRAIDQQAAYGVGIRHLDFTDNVRSLLFKKRVSDVDELRAVISGEGEPALTENPFVIECPDLAATFWEPDFSAVCEVGERTISRVLDAYEDLTFDELGGFEWLTSDTMREYQSSWEKKAMVYHLETEEYIYDVVEAPGEDAQGYMLEYRPNLAGRPCYAFAPGQLTSERDPVEAFLPLVGPMYPIVQLLNVTGTLIQSGALNTGRNMWQEVADRATPVDFMSYHTMPGEQRPQVMIDPAEQMLQKPRPGYHWEPLAVPDQKQLIEAHKELKAELREVGFPAILAPDAPIDATSGYDRSRQMEGAVNFLEPPLANLASSWYELFSLVADIIKTLGLEVTIPVHKRAEGEPLHVRETITIKPDDFREYDQEVRFKSVPATVEYAERESDERMLGMGTMSKPTFMGKHYDDPIAEQERIDKDVVGEQAKQLAHQHAMMIIQEASGNIMEQAAAEAGIPLPMQPPGMGPPGGPAEPGMPRGERPPGGAVAPGLGAPTVAPEQRGPGDTNVPSAGSEAIGVAQ